MKDATLDPRALVATMAVLATDYCGDDMEVARFINYCAERLHVPNPSDIGAWAAPSYEPRWWVTRPEQASRLPESCEPHDLRKPSVQLGVCEFTDLDGRRMRIVANSIGGLLKVEKSQ